MKAKARLTWDIPRTVKVLLLSTLLLSALGLVRCAGGVGEGNRFWLPWYDAQQDTYTWQAIEIKSLHQLMPLAGEVASVLDGPRIEKGGLKGDRPWVRTIADGGGAAYVQDLAPLQSLVVYAHMERLRELDREAESVDLLSWPRIIALNTKVRKRSGQWMFENALYVKDYDAIMITPYNSNDMPIAVNGGVLAHEHFHSIFSQILNRYIGFAIVSQQLDGCLHHKPEAFPALRKSDINEMGNLPREGQELARGSAAHKIVNNLFMLRAWDEGLADFWGWIYEGDEKFMAKSLSYDGLARVVEATAEPLPNAKFLQDAVLVASDESLIKYAYSTGSSVARFLRMALLGEGKSLTSESRRRMAKTLIRGAKALAYQVQGKLESEYLPPYLAVRVILENQEQAPSQEQRRLYKMLTANEDGGVGDLDL